MAERQMLQRRTAEHVFDKPLQQVWPRARQMLFANGYRVAEAEDYNLETRWQVASLGRSRYLLSGIPMDDHSCQIEVLRDDQRRLGETWGDSDIGRDYLFELELIKAVNPERALEIKREGTSARKAASEQ